MAPLGLPSLLPFPAGNEWLHWGYPPCYRSLQAMSGSTGATLLVTVPCRQRVAPLGLPSLLPFPAGNEWLHWGYPPCYRSLQATSGSTGATLLVTYRSLQATSGSTGATLLVTVPCRQRVAPLGLPSLLPFPAGNEWLHWGYPPCYRSLQATSGSTGATLLVTVPCRQRVAPLGLPSLWSKETHGPRLLQQGLRTGGRGQALEAPPTAQRDRTAGTGAGELVSGTARAAVVTLTNYRNGLLTP